MEQAARRENLVFLKLSARQTVPLGAERPQVLNRRIFGRENFRNSRTAKGGRGHALFDRQFSIRFAAI